MNNYKYTIHDSEVFGVPGQPWPAHMQIEIFAASDKDATEAVIEILKEEASNLSTADGYSVNDQIHGLVWEDETLVGHIRHALTIEDLDPDKSDVDDWETVTTYVATFPADDGEGACDVEVQVGTAHGAWFIRTTDDGGGSDDAPDTAYATRGEAVTAAEEFAEEHDEGNGRTAEDYLYKKLVDTAGKPDPKGEWCVYWETVGDDAHVVERYPTEDAARAAAEITSGELEETHPGGRLLCGYSVRQLVEGEWSRLTGENR